MSESIIKGSAPVVAVENSSPAPASATPATEQQLPRGKWARSQVFRKFLFETFECLKVYADATRDLGAEEGEGEGEKEGAGNAAGTSAAHSSNPSSGDTYNTPSFYIPYVLDVAGGKGDVAIPLRVRGVRCGIVDPRVVDLEGTKLMRNVQYHIGEMRGATKTGRAIVRRLRAHEAAARAVENDPFASTANADSIVPPSGDGGGASVLELLPSGADGLPIPPLRLPDIFREWFTADGVYSAPAAAAVTSSTDVKEAAEGTAAVVAGSSVAEEGSAIVPPPKVSKGRRSGRRQQMCAVAAESAALTYAKRMCDVVVGMHPDQATEPILDFALKHKKPFAIVPCCVFPRENPHRRVVMPAVSAPSEATRDAAVEGANAEGGAALADSSNGCATTCSNEAVPVESYEQFIEYLLQKAPAGRIRKAVLPMEGRNIVLYCDRYDE